MTPEQIGALISTAFGGGVLGKMLDKAYGAYKESREIRQHTEDLMDRLRRSRNLYREECAKARYVAVQHGADLPPLPDDPYDE